MRSVSLEQNVLGESGRSPGGSWPPLGANGKDHAFSSEQGEKPVESFQQKSNIIWFRV